MPNEARVKKVNLYPIAANLHLRDGTVISTQILKLTLVGVMADVSVSRIKAGDQLSLSFNLPGIQRLLQEPVVVVKFYNKFVEPSSEKKSAAGGSTSPAQGSPPTGGAAQGAAGGQGAAAQGAGGVKPETPYGNVQHITELHFKPLSSTTASAIRAVFASIGRPL